MCRLVCTLLCLLPNRPGSAQISATDVWGNLMFKDIAKLANSFADYNDDRILFYSKSGTSGSEDFTAVVRPLSFQLHTELDVFFGLIHS